MRNAVYAGSFDPLTTGHLAIIEAAAKMFDRLTIIVAANPDKVGGRFKPRERVAMAKEAVAHLPNVEVENVHGRFIVDWAKAHGCGWMVRGIRGSADLDQERLIEKMNATIVPEIQTVYLTAPVAVENVSSSLVMGLVGNTGWMTYVRPLVPASVFKALVRNQLGKVFAATVSRDDRMWEWVADCYSKPGRVYHTLEHLGEMLDLLDLYAPGVDHIDEIKAATFFHDVVNGEGRDDEEKSADAAFNTLIRAGLNKPQFNVDMICTLIRATAQCGANDHYERYPRAAATLIDADMAVLGRTPEGYDRYAKQIRQEYIRFDDEAYRNGRKVFLASMLARPHIFATPAFREAFDTQAKANMQRELDALKGLPE